MEPGAEKGRLPEVAVSQVPVALILEGAGVNLALLELDGVALPPRAKALSSITATPPSPTRSRFFGRKP